MYWPGKLTGSEAWESTMFAAEGSVSKSLSSSTKDSKARTGFIAIFQTTEVKK